ncbi:hypothetical protein ACWCOW_37135 [Streptomyces sp. NPDC001939]
MTDEPTPIAALLVPMAARQQLAYVDLLKHAADCPACNAHPLCDEGRALRNLSKGRTS